MAWRANGGWPSSTGLDAISCAATVTISLTRASGTPKGMHHDTYMRLFWDHYEAEMEQLIGMREWLDKVEKEVG
jgi:hypothetical protein